VQKKDLKYLVPVKLEENMLIRATFLPRNRKKRKRNLGYFADVEPARLESTKLLLGMK